MGTYDFSEFLTAVKDIRWSNFISMETSTGKDPDQGRETAEKGIKFFSGAFGEKAI
jgi:hypothetical protein